MRDLSFKVLQAKFMLTSLFIMCYERPRDLIKFHMHTRRINIIIDSGVAHIYLSNKSLKAPYYHSEMKDVVP